MQLPYMPSGKKVDANIVNKLIDRVNSLSKITGRNGITVTTSQAGINLIGNGIQSSKPISIFEVQSDDTGDGVYNCHRHIIDGSEWGDTDGDDRIIEKNTDDVMVLNLLEHHVHATYVRQLAAGDRIAAWQSTDDDGDTRWVGIPIGPYGGGRIRRAKAQEDSPGDNKLSVKLCDQDGTEIGAAFDVTCEICGGAALNSAIPRIIAENDEYLFVTNISGTWYCTTVFQTSEDCDCYTAP